MKHTTLIFFFTSILMITGCQTYHLTTESLCQQFVDIKRQRHSPSDNFQPVGLIGALMFSGSVEGNDLKTVKCLDENGKEINIVVTDRTSIRITKKDSSKVTFYFDTLLIKDSTINGSKTHFFEARINPIPLKSITRLEIQE